MTKKAYLSNITAVWPIEVQKELLSSLPDWPAKFVILQDDLDARQRRQTSAATLWHRNNSLLKRTSRTKAEEDIYVASVAVFAVAAEDMILALTLAAKRGATVHFLHEGLTVPPDAGADTLHEVAARFAEARRANRVKGAGRISGDIRMAEAKAKAEKIAARWPLPSADYSTKALLEDASISLNTAKLYLGGRPDAQRAHRIKAQADQTRATARAKRKEAQGT